MSDRFWEIVDGIGFPIFVTNGKDGFPRARPMSLLLRIVVRGFYLRDYTVRSDEIELNASEE